MSQRGMQQETHRRTAVSWAVDRLFVGLIAATGLQASAYAQSPTDGADGTASQSTALPA